VKEIEMDERVKMDEPPRRIPASVVETLRLLSGGLLVEATQGDQARAGRAAAEESLRDTRASYERQGKEVDHLTQLLKAARAEREEMGATVAQLVDNVMRKDKEINEAKTLIKELKEKLQLLDTELQQARAARARSRKRSARSRR